MPERTGGVTPRRGEPLADYPPRCLVAGESVGGHMAAASLHRFP
jgi:acetyl esterase/lipase